MTLPGAHVGAILKDEEAHRLHERGRVLVPAQLTRQRNDQVLVETLLIERFERRSQVGRDRFLPRAKREGASSPRRPPVSTPPRSARSSVERRRAANRGRGRRGRSSRGDRTQAAEGPRIQPESSGERGSSGDARSRGHQCRARLPHARSGSATGLASDESSDARLRVERLPVCSRLR